MTQVKKRGIWTIVAMTWFVFILIALFMPPPEVDEGIRVFAGTDKLIHVGLFGIWTAALSMASIERNGQINYIKILFVIVIVAIATELIQTLIPGRSGETLDVIADLSGGLMILLAMKMWKRA